MGCISKRSTRTGQISWQARIRRANHPEVSASFASRQLAEDWVRQTEADFDRNKQAKAIKQARAKLAQTANLLDLPFGYLIDRYLAEVTPTKRSAAIERIRLRALKQDHIAALKPAELTRAALVAWRDRRMTTVSGDTVIRDLGTIGHIIETARRDWGLELNTNPVRLVRKPRPNPSRERRLAEGEEARLLAEADRSRGGFLRNVITLALETGMRQGEIVGLDWKRVNLTERRVHLVVTKNGSPRGVPLSKRAIVALEATAYRAGPVFPGVTREAVKRAFQNVCKRADIPDLRFHDLRHEATSRFFEKGLNTMEVASITGHKSLKMLRRYTHLDAGRLSSRLD